MISKMSKNIMIAPIGFSKSLVEEVIISKVTGGFKKHVPDILYLILGKELVEPEKIARQHAAKIKDTCKTLNIECREVNLDLLNFVECFEGILKIVQDHKDDKISMNISSGPRVVLLATYTVSMVKKIDSFVVVPSSYKYDQIDKDGSTKGIKEIINIPYLPFFEIKSKKQRTVMKKTAQLLRLIYEHEKINSIDDAINMLGAKYFDKDEITEENRSAARSQVQFYKSYLEELEYIKTKKEGRQTVMYISESGRSILPLLEDLVENM